MTRTTYSYPATARSACLTRRSTEMYTLHEALARDRMSEREAHQVRVARELAAARRWHRKAARAHRAERRHALRAV